MIDTDKYEGHLASEGQTWAWSKWMLKNAESKEQMDATSELLADAPLLLAEVKRLREDNQVLRMIDWEYERVWEWLMENADHTCRKLLLLIEEWKEEDGLVTIGSKEMIE